MLAFKDFAIGCPGRYKPEDMSDYLCERKHYFDPKTREWKGRELCSENGCTAYYAYVMSQRREEP